MPDVPMTDAQLVADAEQAARRLAENLRRLRADLNVRGPGTLAAAEVGRGEMLLEAAIETARRLGSCAIDGDVDDRASALAASDVK